MPENFLADWDQSMAEIDSPFFQMYHNQNCSAPQTKFQLLLTSWGQQYKVTCYIVPMG